MSVVTEAVYLVTFIRPVHAPDTRPIICAEFAGYDRHGRDQWRITVNDDDADSLEDLLSRDHNVAGYERRA